MVYGSNQEDAHPPDSFEWAPLTYPATYEEKQSLIVTKIQQLRDQNRANEIASGVEQPSSERIGDETFEIGVWDPELSAGLSWPNNENRLIESEVNDETVGLVSSAVRSGDLSDDDDDADAVVMFDFAKYLSEKAGAKTTEFAAPRPNIETIGWGDPDDNIPDTPFQILGVGSMIDMNSLVADLQRQIMPEMGRDVSPAISKDPVINEAAKELRVQQVMYLDSMEMIEDRERSQKEDIIDLTQFDDEDQETSPTEALSMDIEYSINEKTSSDEEIEQLGKGEEEKNRRDEAVSLNDIIEIDEFFDSSLPSAHSHFCFASASPSSVDSISTTNTLHSASLAMNNPYGVSPCLMLTALTASNANDGINLERLETIGDSFLKYAVTDYLYHTHYDQHEGKLSFARSKEVSNCNLYRLGKRLGIPSLIVASKFDVQDSWLPPCYLPNVDFKAPNSEDAEERDKFIEDVLNGNTVTNQTVKAPTGWDQPDLNNEVHQLSDGVETINFAKPSVTTAALEELSPLPYNMLTQQYISDKSIADAVEALIGAHLLTLGPQLTLKICLKV
uniref:RNase III domain-containing protein n=1 Tax=Heterorhabditis bacteriophora TaxID=37862 RepID=A0A1I7XTP4_HETBA